MKKDKIIVALDIQDKTQLDFLLKDLQGTASFVKIGMESFFTFGPSLVERVKQLGFKVFLDLKLHDIPNTVYRSCKTLGNLGVDILNVHAAGGTEMMKAAKEGLNESNNDSLLIAVTQLTSTSEKVLHEQILIDQSLEETVLKYSENAKLSGLNGVVCSALEVKKIKEHLGSDFKCITPGIRPKTTSHDDQVRVMTPKEAFEQGSDYLVIGRAIYQAASASTAFNKILKEL